MFRLNFVLFIRRSHTQSRTAVALVSLSSRAGRTSPRVPGLHGEDETSSFADLQLSQLICSGCKLQVPVNLCTDYKTPYAGRANGVEKTVIVRMLMNLK